MGRRAKNTTIIVHEGVYLKLISGFYHCYFRLSDTQFRRSTRTADLAGVKLKALTWFQEAQVKQSRGEQIDCVSFGRLKRSYLEQIKGFPKYGYHSETMERHFLPFFARFDDISKINRAAVLDYLAYRRAKGEKAPTPQTINRENTVLRQMLKFAVDQDWLKAAPKIDNQQDRLTRRRRRHFTLSEYRTLYRTARRRANELDGTDLKTSQSWSRKLLFDVIVLLVNTGLRVDESKTLIWRNIDLDSGTIFLEHAGKTRSTRRLFMRRGAIMALDRIRKRRLEYLSRSGAALDLNERVIALPNGTVIASLKKGFGQLLAACGFSYEKTADRHSMTSLRHTYATLRLTTRSGKRASMRALSKQMGTSERMIERHYGHDQIEDYRQELAGV